MPARKTKTRGTHRIVAIYQKPREILDDPPRDERQAPYESEPHRK